MECYICIQFENVALPIDFKIDDENLSLIIFETIVQCITIVKLCRKM